MTGHARSFHCARPLKQPIVQRALVVRDYDGALAFYVGTLGFVCAG